MITVIDCNAAIEIALNREKGKTFRKFIEISEKTVSSEFFRIEAANVIYKYYRGNFIKRTECIKLLELSESYIDEFIPIKDNYFEAMNEAIRLKFPAYDMLYLTLARRMGATLLTLDRSLNNIAKKEGIETAG